MVDVQFTCAQIGRLSLPDDHFDEGGLSRTVGSEDGHAGGEGHFEGYGVECVGCGAGVAEVDVVHLEEFLGGCTDALEAAWVWECEFEVGCGQFEVMFRLGLFLDEFRHFSAVNEKDKGIKGGAI